MYTTETKKNNWQSELIESILSHFATEYSGISEAESKKRLGMYGCNLVPPAPRRHWIKRLLLQFHNVLIYVLLVAALITLFLGKYVDASVILGVVLINTIIGFFQEGKAEDAIAAVQQMLPIFATVLRDNKRFTIPASELVPGDIVILQSGDKVPADCRLFATKNLRINEALLTGESESIEKNIAALPKDTPTADRTNMAFSGTLVTAGKGKGVVVGTGKATEIGRISQSLTEVKSLTTPLLRKMSIFSRWLTLLILIISATFFAYGIFVHDYSVEEMFVAAISIAVASIPEGLPIVLTITLAIGVRHMAKRHAIIRRLPAVETLGSMEVICSDKTGTLTRNEMSVQTVSLVKGDITVSGTGYVSQGEFYLENKNIHASKHSDLLELCKAAVLCNEADLHFSTHDHNGNVQLHGDPTEGAMLSLGAKAGLDHHLLRKEFPMTDVIPFESEYRYMASLHHDHLGHGFIYIKGAPEVILQRCNLELQDGETKPINSRYWQHHIEKIAGQGQRPIAIAFRPTSSTQRTLQFNDVEAGLILFGVVGIIDPPREEAIEAIAACHKANIIVKMITGDHAITATAIAKQLGLGDGLQVLTGEQLDEMDDDTFKRSIDQVNVFARTSPQHKLRLVKAMQDKGYVIAMTGDGVNDAPALKRADVGVAMGLKGTEVAKEVSEMVITDDNFISIVEAVKEGRTVYDNLKKAILFLLPINGGEALSIVVAILFGYTLPITPAQILWVNMVSSVTLTMSLAFEQSEKNIMHRPPTPLKESLLSKLLVWRIVFVSVTFLLGIFGIFNYGLSQGLSIEESRTLAVNTLVILEVFYLFSSRYIHGPSLTWQGVRGTRAVMIAIGIVALLQLSFTYVPFMQYFFKTDSISFIQCLWIGAIGVGGFAIMESEKLLMLAVRKKRFNEIKS
jgi:magnesium-transporting ATPase (P-type)